MLRAERRREERKNKSLYKWLMSLNREQKMLLTEYCVEATKSDILAFGQAFERVMRVKFYETFGDIEEAEAYLKAIVDLVEEEGIKIKECYNGSVEYMANLKQCKDEMVKKYEDKKAAAVKDKEIFNQLKMDYPRFTLSAIKNVIAEYKRDLKKAEPVIVDDLDTEEIVKNIFEDAEIEECENKANTEELEPKCINTQEVEKEVLQEPIKVKEDMLNASLVEITEVRKFKGQFGEYIKTKNGVKTEDLIIKTQDEADKYKEAVNIRLEEERKIFEKKQEEQRNKAYGKLNEIVQLLEM